MELLTAKEKEIVALALLSVVVNHISDKPEPLKSQMQSDIETVAKKLGVYDLLKFHSKSAAEYIEKNRPE